MKTYSIAETTLIREFRIEEQTGEKMGQEKLTGGAFLMQHNPRTKTGFAVN